MALRTVEGEVSSGVWPHATPAVPSPPPEHSDLGPLTSFLFPSFLSYQHFPAVPDSLPTLVFNLF